MSNENETIPTCHFCGKTINVGVTIHYDTTPRIDRTICRECIDESKRFHLWEFVTLMYPVMAKGEVLEVTQ